MEPMITPKKVQNRRIIVSDFLDIVIFIVLWEETEFRGREGLSTSMGTEGRCEALF
jgi:hypothetical protein